MRVHEHNISPESREIWLHPYICDDLVDGGVDYRSAVRFIKNLRFLDAQNQRSITVHMVIDGGNWYYGMAIYDAIVACVAKVTIIAYAHARSMSSLILQAADKRILMPNCLFLVHQGTEVFDDRSDLWPVAYKSYQRELKTMLKIYAERMQNAKMFKGKTIPEITACIRAQLKDHVDWVMTAEEAVRFGLADEVYNVE